MSSEFVVSAEKHDNVAKRLSRIQDVFGVRVECGEPGGSPCGDSGCILPSDAGDPDIAGSDSTALGPVWVHVFGETEQACEKAKEYILSVCSDRSIEEKLTRQTLDMLDGRIPRLEYDSGAVIERLPGDKLRIQGSDENIVRAQSLICSKTSAGAHGLENGAIHVRREPSRTITASSRTDFSDSSHSTQEDESDRKALVENGIPSRVARGDELQTKAVPSSPTPSLTSSSSSASSLAKSDSQNKHEDIIALMLKLGYARQIVEQVLLQIGDQASSDEVLRMLVNLGSPKITEDSGNDAKESEGASGRKDFCDGVAEPEDVDTDPYRPIIIDGSNVAMSYGNSNVFDCQGIHTVVMWFLMRGHKIIYVFVPSWRKEQSKPETPIKDQEILMQLEKSKILVWTPSRRVKGRRLVCYDDRYILNLAHELDGIVVSNDTFRDLCAEKPEHRKVVEERLLMYSFAGDKFMPPDDPLGRHGPSLENFLRKTPAKPSHQMQLCPYGKKCTYGNKCKYSHPERSRNVKTTSEILMEKDRQRQQQKIEANLLARAHKTEMLEMPWEKEDGKGRNATEPIMKHLVANSSGMLRGGATQQHGGAVTLPLRNPPMPDTSMNTVPLMGPQHMQQVQGYGIPTQNLQSINESWLPLDEGVPEGWLPADQRLPASYPHPHSQTHSSTVNQHHHQMTSPAQLRNQPLPNRSSLTAPLPSYTPHSHPPRDMMTAPLSTPEYYQHHASQQTRNNRYSLPMGRVEQQRPTLQQVHPSYRRDRGNIGDISHEFNQMSLHDTTSHSSAFDEERHYSYPLTAPYRGSAGLTTQTATNPYIDDEGYYSPITPKDQSIPSPLPHPSSSSRHSALHPSSDSVAAHAQSHLPRFRYPSSAPSVPPASSASVPYTLPPPSSKPPGPHQISGGGGGGGGGTDPLSYGGHLGVPQVPPRHIAHSMGSPRGTSEPVPQRQVWGDVGQERLPDALRQLPGEDDASYQEMLRRVSSGLSGQP